MQVLKIHGCYCDVKLRTSSPESLYTAGAVLSSALNTLCLICSKFTISYKHVLVLTVITERTFHLSPELSYNQRITKKEYPHPFLYFPVLQGYLLTTKLM